jgi:hypothetical protein
VIQPPLPHLIPLYICVIIVAASLRLNTVKKHQKSSAFYRTWRSKAGQVIRRAAIAGRLSIVAEHNNGKRVLVPPKILLRMKTVRGTLKDLPEFSKPLPGHLHGYILNGARLFVPLEEFWGWHDRSDYIPSDLQNSRAPPGRPSKQTEALKAKVWQALEDGRWTDTSVRQLHHVLLLEGANVSYRTVARLVVTLYRETRDSRISRRQHRR